MNQAATPNGELDPPLFKDATPNYEPKYALTQVTTAMVDICAHGNPRKREQVRTVLENIAKQYYIVPRTNPLPTLAREGVIVEVSNVCCHGTGQGACPMQPGCKQVPAYAYEPNISG